MQKKELLRSVDDFKLISKNFNDKYLNDSLDMCRKVVENLRKHKLDKRLYGELFTIQLLWPGLSKINEDIYKAIEKLENIIEAITDDVAED